MENDRRYEPYYGPPYEQPKLREVGTKRDMIFAAVFLLLSILAVNFYRCGVGLTASLASIALFSTGVVYIFPHRVRCSPYAITCMSLYILCALVLVFSDASFGKICAMFAMVVLSGLTLMELRGLRERRAGTLGAVKDWCNVVIRHSFGSVGAVCFALFHRENGEGAVQKRRIGNVLIGILCAVPALIIIVPLLNSADAAFQNLLKTITVDGESDLPMTLLFGIGLFFLLFGQHFAARHAEISEEEPTQTYGWIDATVLIAFLSAISVVYLLYLISQLAYFFSAFSGLLPSDFTVAQYARRGFFEMVLLCLINLGIVMFALWGVRREGENEPRIIRFFALFLCVFSLVLIATALSKMFLYIDSFGMTHLRILTSVFMVFLAVVLCTVALWLFVRRIPYLKVACITAVLLIVVTGFADLDRLVASYNVNAYLSGELDTIDMAELSVLSSDSVVPYVWELTDDDDAKVAASAYRILLDKLIEHGLVESSGIYTAFHTIEASYDWRSYNLPEYEAFCLLQEHAQEILAYTNP